MVLAHQALQGDIEQAPDGKLTALHDVSHLFSVFHSERALWLERG